MFMKQVVITGGSKGIGRACAELFAANGYTVLVTGRTESTLRKTVKSLEGSNHTYVVGDVADAATAEQIRDNVEQIDVLVNNAGFGVFKPVEDMKEEEFMSQFSVNVKGVFLTTKSLLPLFRSQDEGTVITISSMAGQSHFANGTAYSATKWAVEGFVGSLKKELRDTHVKCCSILPGSVDTSFFDALPFGPTEDRHLEPEDVAETVYFVANQPDSADIDRIVLRPAKR